MKNHWLERYTYAVKSHLPAHSRQDLGDELLSDLQDECDYREQSLGRALTEEEIKALLKERGHPLLVAADFRPRPTLVSESLFPIYWQLLQWMVLAIAAVQVCLAGLTAIQNAEVNIWQLLPQTCWAIVDKSLYGFAWLTLVFYLIGETVSRGDLFKHWKPENLPPVTAEGDPINRTGSTFEIIVLVYFAAWINHIIPQSLGDNPITLVFAEQWPTLLPWINALILASIAVAAVKLISPYWTRRKIVVDLLLHLPTLAILAVVYSWESALGIVIGTGEHAKSFDFGPTAVSMVILGYAVVALIDLIGKVRIYRAIT